MSDLALSRGALCISIDLELAWGVWDKLTDEYAALVAAHERSVVARLLDLFRSYEVEATWAIVGQLLVADRNREVAGRGPDAIWFARDIVELIRASEPRQEIGSHGFAHVYFGDLAARNADEDLDAARRVHAAEQLPFSSFVFPRNEVAHVGLLRCHGLQVYRSRDAGLLSLADRRARRVRPLVNFADKAIPWPAPIVWPRLHPSGIVELPSSLLLLARKGPRDPIPPASMIAKCRLALRAASARAGVFHLWFHPSNFYRRPQRQFDVLEAVLRDAAARRDAGILDIRTMGSFAHAASQAAQTTAPRFALGPR